ncbi:hypothetical protein [Chryseobacterium scophthalmum]|uniref:Uncharacterized protein n=1 Tax=Chryseobacterium scophthalmum TaxID=59733 RepID=A0A1N6J4D1_9FLAO|nr:hypothetical protein [Chryseobacterium scophthalmum]SIO39059.1 hypothetical protein SAMN05421769_4071 [Chryseobacterium scophthalmum]
MIHQPYYTIDFTAVNCRFEVLINDIPVISLETEGQMSPNVPINFGIFSPGKQNVVINLFPVSGQNIIDDKTKFEYVIKLFNVQGETFTHVKDCVTNKIQISQKVSDFKHSSSFEADISYEMSTLEYSKDLSLDLKNNISVITEKLDLIYKKISDCFANKQYESLFEMIKNREKNMASAMYLSDADANARINSLITDSQNGFSPMPLSHDKVLKIYGNGKLATYKKNNGEPAFFLFNPNTGEELMLELMFHIPNGKAEFEVI